jgi:hypothetical protein
MLNCKNRPKRSLILLPSNPFFFHLLYCSSPFLACHKVMHVHICGSTSPPLLNVFKFTTSAFLLWKPFISSEATSRSVSHENPLLLWNRTFNCRIYNSSPWLLIVGRMNSAHTVTHNFFRDNLDIIIPFTPVSLKWPLHILVDLVTLIIYVVGASIQSLWIFDKLMFFSINVSIKIFLNQMHQMWVAEYRRLRLRNNYDDDDEKNSNIYYAKSNTKYLTDCFQLLI